MEKPSKKETYEHKNINGMIEVDARYNAGWNDCHDAMSTWIEGAVPSEDELIEIMLNSSHGCIHESDATNAAQAIHALITRKLTGKEK